MNNQFFFGALLAFFSIGGTKAQVMVEAEMTGQPLSYSKNGVVEGCGVRVVGVITPVPGEKTFKTFDISANFWKSGQALVKMIGQELPVANPMPSQAQRKVLNNGWLKAEGKTPAAPADDGFKASVTDKGAYLFAVNFESSADFVMAAAHNERVQVAVNWDGKAEWIYSGTVKITQQEKIQIAQCTKEVIAN